MDDLSNISKRLDTIESKVGFVEDKLKEVLKVVDLIHGDRDLLEQIFLLLQTGLQGTETAIKMLKENVKQSTQITKSEAQGIKQKIEESNE